MQNLKTKTNKTKPKVIDTKNRLVVARGEVVGVSWEGEMGEGD